MYSATALLVILSLVGIVKPDEEPTVEITDSGDSGYFTEEWRNEFDEEKIAKQPKWKLAEKQPTNGTYEVRDYAPAWWVTSYTPCLNQTVAGSYGYLMLYIYMNKYNSQFAQYDLTYPILNKVEIAAERPGITEKDPRTSFCPDRFSVNFFLPYPAADGDQYNNPARGLDDSIVTSEDYVTKRRFVMRYEDLFTYDSNDNCNYHAAIFATQLAMDEKIFNPNTYYCAMYEKGKSGITSFEVWFDEMSA